MEEAIRREACEEAGVALENLVLFGAYTTFTEYKNDHIVVFACDAFSLSGETDREIECAQFFPLDKLPTDLASGCLRRVQEYISGTWPTFGAW